MPAERNWRVAYAAVLGAMAVEIALLAWMSWSYG
jgi:hypothetical protein